jgi:hypothetical protein
MRLEDTVCEMVKAHYRKMTNGFVLPRKTASRHLAREDDGWRLPRKDSVRRVVGLRSVRLGFRGDLAGSVAAETSGRTRSILRLLVIVCRGRGPLEGDGLFLVWPGGIWWLGGGIRFRVDGTGDANFPAAVGTVNEQTGAGCVDYHVLLALWAAKEDIHKRPTFFFAPPVEC